VVIYDPIIEVLMTVAGKLYLVATPIGNLEDISARALRILREADLIACEDTRHSAKLLSHYGIATPRRSYYEHNEAVRTAQLLEILRTGKNVALISDAGMPLISDPGFTLVKTCREEGIPVVPIPGASAAISALSASGLPTDSFYFAGFLPSRSSARRKALEKLRRIPVTLVFYEAPHRLLEALEDMAEILGPRKSCLARELTKIYEEWLYGSLPEILQQLSQRESIRGEITLVVEGGNEDTGAAQPYPESIEQHLVEEMNRTGADQKQALKEVARQRGLTRRQAYDLLVNEKHKQ
jgi:16S rRNA (cytidine1402-2'-O)-methyltransferase